jgi:hypothetical protein
VDPTFVGSNPVERDGFLSVIKIHTITSFGGEVKLLDRVVRFYVMLKNNRCMNRDTYRQNSQTNLARFLPTSIIGVSAAEKSGG